MKNVTKVVGHGYKPKKSIFGVSINYYSAYLFHNKSTGQFAVALVNGKTDTVCDDERTYVFANEKLYEEWKDKIYEELHYQDENLLVRAYPVFANNSDDHE